MKKKYKIDIASNILSIYNWSYGSIPISELKLWVDAQIYAGKNNVKLDISWGYYNDIDELEIIAE